MSDGQRSETAILEQQVEQLRDQLRQAQKLTALGELVSTTTHEFNNVLMTIVNYAKIGLRHRDEATRNKAFEKILAGGQRAAKITNGVLGFARNRPPGRQPTDVARLVHDAIVLLEREMQKHRIAIELRTDGVPPILADGNQIQQVLINLLVNARQAMPRGGSVHLQAIHEVDADVVEIRVRDSGSGIPAEDLNRIFDRFYSTKTGPDRTGKGGTGLGLSMCKDIVESHGGTIRVESRVGKGTEFAIRLPVASQQASPRTKPIQALGIPAVST